MSKHKCYECDREFGSEEALSMHNNSKHYKEPAKPKISSKKVKFWSITIAIVAVIIFASYGLYANSQKPGEYDEFAQCITDSGAKMFGAYWCPHCLEQKDSFGRSWKKIDYIECSLPNRAGQTAYCTGEGVQSYPTWEFSDGDRRSGFLSLQALSDITGCPL